MDLSQLLNIAIKQQASDLHLSPGTPPLLRVQGELIKISGSDTIKAEHVRHWLYSLMDDQQIKTFETRHELDFSCVMPTLGSFRIHVFQQMHGVAAVFRMIPRE